MDENDGRDGTNEDQWRARLEAWKTSGLSVRAFCERESISLNTFRYWKDKIESRRKGAAVVKGPVRLAHLLPTIEIVISERFTVRVPAGFRADELVRLIEVLEGLR